MSREPVYAIPLWAPHYTSTFGDAIGRFWRKYVNFSGRASRREYWWTYLFLAIGYLIALTLIYVPLIVTSVNNEQPNAIFAIGVFLFCAWFLGTIVPWLALEARRLHDGNFSALFLLLHLATTFGAIAVFVMCQLNPNPVGRRFDAPPGEAPRHQLPGNWPPAPGEPNWYANVPPAYYPPAPNSHAEPGNTPR